MNAVGSLWLALHEVLDPEIPISVVDLGLIYDIRGQAGHVEIDLTFTATGCPCMVFIKHDVVQRLLREPGVERVTLNEVWDPPWNTARVTPRGRTRLKELGVSL